MKILELGHVVLYVTNLERSGRFYRETLGFREIGSMPGARAFSSGRTHHELLLIEVGGKPEPHRQLKPGLYHIGFKVGNSPEELRAVYKELKEQNIPIVGTADHHVTHSIYLLDPDGNELELYADVSDTWKHDPREVLRPVRVLNLD